MSDETSTLTEPERAPGSHRKESSGGSFFRELPFLVLIAFVLALLIKALLVQAFYIPSGSMQHTLELRDRVLVKKRVYHFRHIHRRETLVFNGLDSFTPEPQRAQPRNGGERVLASSSEVVDVGEADDRHVIKRRIGVPGVRVGGRPNGHVDVQTAGGSAVELHEPYLFVNAQQVFCNAGSGSD